MEEAITQLTNVLKKLQTESKQPSTSSITSSNSTTEVQLYPYDELNETFDLYLQRLENYFELKELSDATDTGDKNDPVEENSATLSGLSSFLKNHFVSGPARFPCGVCGLAFKTASKLRKHSIIHKSPSEVHMYKCEKCPFQSRHRSSIKSHDMNVHASPSQLKRYSCEKCDYQTNHTNVFKKHLVLKHSSLTAATTKKEKKVHKCEICGHTTKTKFLLQQHAVSHKKPSELNMKKCPLCPYQSKRQSGVANHMLFHKNSSETPLFKCELCPYESKWRHCLRNHLKVHEKKDEKLTIRKCDICEFTTNNIYSLEVHMRSHKLPSDETPKEFICYTCGHRTTMKNKLVIHMLVHKPLWQLQLFECHVCGIRTKTKYSLRNHILTVHLLQANDIKPNF